MNYDACGSFVINDEPRQLWSYDLHIAILINTHFAAFKSQAYILQYFSDLHRDILYNSL